MQIRTRRRTALVLAALLTAVLTGWTSGSSSVQQAPSGSTLNRPIDPVVLTGQQLSGLVGTQPNRIVAFATAGSGWAQIPVQVDERKDTTMAAVYNLPTTQTFYGSSINVPVKVYADPNTFTGADTNAAFDADDEIAFMAHDAGGPRGDRAAPAGTTGQAIEVKLTEPGATDQVGYVYLFTSSGSLDPGAGERYVNYEFRLNSGDYKTTFNRTNGPNPENSTVTGATYSTHFSDRWLQDELRLTRGGSPTVDLIDRVKYDIQLLCARNENTFNDEEGAFVINKSGPVRAIRSIVGSNSGPNTQNTQIFYESAVDTITDLRVHAIPNVGAHLDFSSGAQGMTYRNPRVPNGVAIDGQPDTIPAGTPTWWTFLGNQGGLGMAVKIDQNVTQPPVTWYEDDATPTTTQCTGDSQAIGDSGAWFNQWINCTDPGTGCNGRLHTELRIVAAASGVSAAELQRQTEHHLRPLEVAVNGQGPDPDPDPDPECFTAANSAHVTAGRATSWLVFAWATGTNEYLGLTWATTSLRREGNGWRLVTSC
jgi:hypothetical protein